MSFLKTWQAFALGSAFFAALTAVFGKMGVSELKSEFRDLRAHRRHFAGHGTRRLCETRMAGAAQRFYVQPNVLDLVGSRNGLLMALLLPGIAARTRLFGRSGRQAQRGPRHDLRVGFLW